MEFNKKDLLDEHLNELSGKCPEQPVLCPYSDIGCNANSNGKFNKKKTIFHIFKYSKSKIKI